jgi:hypothetical protein
MNTAHGASRSASNPATASCVRGESMEHSKHKERVPLLPVGGGLPEPADESASQSQVYKLPIFDIRVSVDAALRVGVCVLLCMQNSAYTLARRYGSGVLKEAASSQSILAVGEIMKLLFSVAMIRRQQAGAEAAESLAAAARRLVTSSLPMAVPALIFLAMNLLSFVALRRISASAFTLIQQGKIVATAMLSRFLLGKLISPARWRALCTLLCAVLIICHQTHPQTVQACSTEDAAASSAGSAGGAGGAGGAQSPQSPQADEAERLATEAYSEYAIGLAAVAVEAGLSGLSNVYFEKVSRVVVVRGRSSSEVVGGGGGGSSSSSSSSSSSAYLRPYSPTHQSTPLSLCMVTYR